MIVSNNKKTQNTNTNMSIYMFMPLVASLEAMSTPFRFLSELPKLQYQQLTFRTIEENIMCGVWSCFYGYCGLYVLKSSVQLSALGIVSLIVPSILK
jgi:hypothetical protein